MPKLARSPLWSEVAFEHRPSARAKNWPGSLPAFVVGDQHLAGRSPASPCTVISSKPKHLLGNDVALDFRAPAEDRVGAAVEMTGHHAEHVFRDDRLVIESVERTALFLHECILPDHFNSH